MRSIRPPHDVMIALAAAGVYLVISLVSTHIARCDGFGDDGCLYGGWARDFVGRVVDQKLSSFYVQRCFPSLVAWAAMKALAITPDPPNVIRVFQAMNVACVFVAAFTWAKIARILAIRPPAMLLGTLALFGSYGLVKFTTYYPVIHDAWAYALGFVGLWAHLARRPWVLVPACLVAAFTWPSATAPLLLLLFFARGEDRTEDRDTPLRPRLGTAVGIVLAAVWAAFAVSLVVRGYWPPAVAPVEQLPRLVPVSVLVSALYVLFAVRPLASYGPAYHPRTYLRALASWPAAAAILLVIAVRVIIARASVPDVQGFGQWLEVTGIFTTTKPASFVVGHVVYYGPLLLVLGLRWREVCALVRRQGLGMVGVAMLAVLFGLDSEARHSFTFVALLMPFGIKVLDGIAFGRRTAIVLAVLTLIASKLWLRLPGWLEAPLWAMPNQLVFMSQGPWMANWAWALQGAIALAAGIWMHRVLRPSPT